MTGFTRIRQHFVVLAVLILAMGVPLRGYAQINPFEDADEEEEKKDDKKAEEKKAEEKKAEEEKKKDEEEAKKEEKAKEAEAAAKEKADKEAAEKAAKEKAEKEAAEEEEAEAAEKEKAEKAEKEAAEKEAAEKAERKAAFASRVPLTQNFGRPELITTGVVLPVGLGLAIGGTRLFGEPPASMTTPELGSLDYRLSISSHGDLEEGSPFLFGIFDVAGIAYPSAVGGFYLVSGLYLWAADEPMLSSQSINIDHSMIAMAQTVGWTALASGLTHMLIGRQRPYAAFDRTAYGDAEAVGANGSFFSTTAALSFAMSSFAARDYASWATRRGQNPITGIVAPYVILYGISSIIGYSSIYNQQHYPSDIIVAAVLGSLIGNLTYAAHFDRKGNPRARYEKVAKAFGPTLLRSPEGTAKMGFGFNWKW